MIHVRGTRVSLRSRRIQAPVPPLRDIDPGACRRFADQVCRVGIGEWDGFS
jgi:hypothetical protein